MHYNLLFNGCSITHGDELEGKNQDYEYQRTHRFSHLVAENLGMVYNNISVPGSSNDRIVRETIEWFEAGNTCDLAIIQFTYLERLEYICGFYNKPLKINIALTKDYFWKIQNHVKNYYEFSKQMILSYYKDVYNNNDAFYRFYKNLFLLETYFEKNNIRYQFIRVNNSKIKFDKTVYLWKNLCKHKYNEMVTICDGILNVPFNGEDYCKNIANADHPFLFGHHPSELGHQKIANYLINKINE